nr:MAG TPA: hypothetical protein [Crassvirales sp.]
MCVPFSFGCNRSGVWLIFHLYTDHLSFRCILGDL